MTNVCIHAPVLAGQIETVTGQSDCKDNKSAVVSPGLVSSHTSLPETSDIQWFLLETYSDSDKCAVSRDGTQWFISSHICNCNN